MKNTAKLIALGLMIMIGHYLTAQDQCLFKDNKVIINSNSTATEYITYAKEVFTNYNFTRYFIDNDTIKYIDIISDDKFVIVYHNKVEEYHGR